MKLPMISVLVPCLAVVALMAASCAPIAPPERMACRPEVRAMSSMDYGTFKQMMGGAGGVAMVDEAVAEKKGRELVKVEAVAKGNSRESGKERWTVRHADGGTAIYQVRWMGPVMEVTPERE